MSYKIGDYVKYINDGKYNDNNSGPSSLILNNIYQVREYYKNTSGYYFMKVLNEIGELTGSLSESRFIPANGVDEPNKKVDYMKLLEDF